MHLLAQSDWAAFEAERFVSDFRLGQKGLTAGKASSRGSEVVTSEQPNGQGICAVTMDLSEDGLK